MRVFSKKRFWVLICSKIVCVMFFSYFGVPNAMADQVVYTISDGSLTPTLVTGACDNSQTNSTPTDGAQGTVISSACNGRNDQITVKWIKTLSWEDMGVPANSTVSEVDGSFLYRTSAETHATAQIMGPMSLKDSTDTSACASTDLESSFDPGDVNASFTARDASGVVAVSAGCQASDTTVTIRLDLGPRAGNNGSANSELRADDIELVIEYSATAVAPAVSTRAATNVGASGANVNGAIISDGGGSITDHGFAYGTSANLTTNTATTSMGALSLSEFSQATTTLSAATTYYYRAYAANAGGDGLGAIRSFTTGNTTIVRKVRLFAGFIIRLLEGRVILFES